MIALAQAGVNTLEEYEAIQGYLDIDDLIDYMLIHQYTSNRDGPEEFNSNNMRGLRKREPGAQFRFFMWDMDYSLWEVDRNINIDVAISGSISFVYPRRRAFPEFRLRYADHVRTHLFNDGALTPDRVLERWNRRSDEIFSALIGESARWGDAKRPAQPYTRDVEWAEERRRLVEECFPGRTEVLIKQLKDPDLYTKALAPNFNHHGGRVSSDFVLTMTAGTLFSPHRGEFVYTTDGGDTRVYGTGERSATAMVYDGGISLTKSTTIKARSVNNGDWSALNEATFVIGSAPTPEEPLKISEIHYRPAPSTEAELAAGFDRRSDFEFLELFNAGFERVDLTSLEFTRGLTLFFRDLEVLDLAPGATVLLVGNQDAFTLRYGAGLPVIGEFAQGKLNDDGETIIFVLDADVVIQEIPYNDQALWPESADGEGFSLTLIDPTSDAALEDPASWRASTAPGGSPGIVEPGGAPTAVIVSTIMVTQDVIEAKTYWILSIDQSTLNGSSY
jgi:hypothetical protein